MTIVGKWVIDESDPHALDNFGDVALEFDEDGNLIYIIRSDDKREVILMRYEIDGNILITDQPSAPRVERTAFSLSADGTLILKFGGEPFRFRRQ